MREDIYIDRQTGQVGTFSEILTTWLEQPYDKNGVKIKAGDTIEYSKIGSTGTYTRIVKDGDTFEDVFGKPKIIKRI